MQLAAPLFLNTGEVDALMDRLQAAVDALNMDITNWYNANKTNTKAADFANAWIKWRDDAYGTIKTWRNGLFHLAWNYYDAAQTKLGDLNTWRGSFAAASGRQATGPAPQVPPDSPASTVLMALAVVGVLGVAGYVGVQIYAAARMARTGGRFVRAAVAA